MRPETRTGTEQYRDEYEGIWICGRWLQYERLVRRSIKRDLQTSLMLLCNHLNVAAEAEELSHLFFEALSILLPRLAWDEQIDERTGT